MEGKNVRSCRTMGCHWMKVNTLKESNFDAQDTSQEGKDDQHRKYKQQGDPYSLASSDASRVQKSSSPLQSASQTTGSSSTPTSIGNASSGEQHATKGPVPDFPKSFTPPPVPEEGVWRPEASPSAAAAVPYNTPERNAGSAIKLLVSNNVAGSIIGRAGQTISELQDESHTRIKLSQAGDYYPGTQDRVCLVQGEKDAVKVALKLLTERMYMLQENQYSQIAAYQGITPSFDFVVRLLVPLSSCGMIIGKSGSNIKFMEETTGVASIRLSPKDEMSATSERIVTISGADSQCCLRCIYLIFDELTSHPDISRYVNMTTSYATITSPVYNQPQVLLPPSPTRHAAPSPTMQHIMWDSGPNTSMIRRFASSPDLTGIIPNQRPSSRLPLHQERLATFGQHNVPVHVPSESGIALGGQQHLPLYLVPRHTSVEPQLLDFNREGGADGQGLHHHASPQHHHLNHHSVSHSASAPNLLAVQPEQSLHFSPPSLSSPLPQTHPSPPSPHEYTSNTALISQAPTMIAPGCFTAQVLIPDSMVGSILGRGGQTLNELQMLSGTRIRISQRGEYMPGTRSRIVTIRGTTAQSVWQAQYMMSQRIVLPPTASFSAQSHQSPNYSEPPPPSDPSNTRETSP